jgi:predicted regulator of Ras-like GTPase activity (Roadblock/LC7/MglB family)
VARRGADRHTGRPDALDLVARVALAQGDAPGAEKAWTTALTISPEFGAAHRGLGFLRYQQGRLAEAEQHLGAARTASPNDPALEAAWRELQSAHAEQRASAAHAVVVEEAVVPSSDGGAAALFDGALGDSKQVALLLDRDGLVVAGRYETADGTDLGAVIGAHLSGVSDEAARAMRHFGLGAWTRIALESEAATIVMAPSGEGVAFPLTSARRRFPRGSKRECGTDALSKSAAAPATVSGEPGPECHWGRPREGRA